MRFTFHVERRINHIGAHWVPEMAHFCPALGTVGTVEPRLSALPVARTAGYDQIADAGKIVVSAHAVRRCRDYPTRMTGFLGPPGACDACGRCCCTLDQVGIPCYHCHAGVFMDRRWWTFTQDRFGTWLATPREDIDVAALAAERARITHLTVNGSSSRPARTRDRKTRTARPRP